MHRWVEWRITMRAKNHYEVVRLGDFGEVVRVGVCRTKDEAFSRYEVDRAQVLADGRYFEGRSLEFRAK